MTTASTSRFGVFEALRLWFSLEESVNRRAYIVTGISLMALKYAVEAFAIQMVTGSWWSPLQSFSPFFVERSDMLERTPTWFGVALAAWTLPFLWIGATMTMRRAVNAGFSGWLGLVFFVPLANYIVLVLLSVSPERPRLSDSDPLGDNPFPDETTTTRLDPPLRSALLAMLSGVAIMVIMVLLSVSPFAPYGMGLFLGSPFVVGTVGGYIHNRRELRTLNSTLLVALATCLIGGGALLIFALEGIVCIAMSLGLALPLALFGAAFGRVLTRHAPPDPLQATFAIALLPLASILEGQLVAEALPVFETVTAVEIDAPPEIVWEHVIAFSEIPEPTEWLFRTGVAYPIRARIDGSGVGAVRHCEFSTGPFVEPITHWEPPMRLAFDVSAHPDPMEEWSFYDQLHPPHLDTAFQSQRGEFRLVALPDGGTRLEGSTWYTLDLVPTWYWRVMSEPLVHAIHGRVLGHIRALAEADARR